VHLSEDRELGDARPFGEKERPIRLLRPVIAPPT